MLPGVHPAPNIQTSPDVYEIENGAIDRDGKIEAVMAAIAPWDGKVVLDIGAGTGYHLPHFHRTASHVIAVEPNGPSRLRTMARTAALGLERVSVVTGSAERPSCQRRASTSSTPASPTSLVQAANQAWPKWRASSVRAVPPSSSTTTSGRERSRRGFGASRPGPRPTRTRSRVFGATTGLT